MLYDPLGRIGLQMSGECQVEPKGEAKHIITADLGAFCCSKTHCTLTTVYVLPDHGLSADPDHAWAMCCPTPALSNDELNQSCGLRRASPAIDHLRVL